MSSFPIIVQRFSSNYPALGKWDRSRKNCLDCLDCLNCLNLVPSVKFAYVASVTWSVHWTEKGIIWTWYNLFFCRFFCFFCCLLSYVAVCFFLSASVCKWNTFIRFLQECSLPFSFILYVKQFEPLIQNKFGYSLLFFFLPSDVLFFLFFFSTAFVVLFFGEVFKIFFWKSKNGKNKTGLKGKPQAVSCLHNYWPALRYSRYSRYSTVNSTCAYLCIPAGADLAFFTGRSYSCFMCNHPFRLDLIEKCNFGQHVIWKFNLSYGKVNITRPAF